MKIISLFFVGILILMTGCVNDQSAEIAQLKQQLNDLKALFGPPPTSLNNLYPPRAEAPVFLIKMFELAAPLSGIAVDMNEGDIEQSRAHFARFRTQYLEVSKMVPEWETEYPLEPVEELEVSLETGNPEKVMAAIGNVGKVCQNCHIANMDKVQQKYHWDAFSGIGVADPVTNEELKFDQFMSYLELSLSGIGVDIEQEQAENALKHFDTFNRRYQVLKETCENCHETERKYFVDESVQVLIDQLGETLRISSPNPKIVGELNQRIGMEGCIKCHWVHIPAAYSQARWKEWEKDKRKLFSNLDR